MGYTKLSDFVDFVFSVFESDCNLFDISIFFYIVETCLQVLINQNSHIFSILHGWNAMANITKKRLYNFDPLNSTFKQ